MYLLNTEIVIQWELPPTGSPPDLTDLDIIQISPIGLSSYFDAPIAAPDYVVPTVTLPGSVTYRFTPLIEGTWAIKLVIGTSLSYQLLEVSQFFVFDKSTTTPPTSFTPLGHNGAIQVGDDGGLIENEATRINFTGAGFTVSTVNGVVTVNLIDLPVAPYQNANDLLAALTGAINESILTTNLNNRLDLIDGIGVGSVNERIGVVSSQVSTLSGTVNDPVSGLSSVYSGLVSASNWITQLDTAMTVEVGSKELFVSQVGDNVTAIENQIVITDGLSAQYTIKVDNNGHVSGFGLASTAVDGTPLSEFAINADKFSITAPGSASPGDSPFFHISVPTIINGTLVPAGTYMESAFIHDAAITNAMIGNVIQSADGGIAWSIDKSGGISGRQITLRAIDNGDVLISSDRTGVLYDLLADLQNQVDGAITLWYYEHVPTLLNEPYTLWTTDPERDSHLGDICYNTTTGIAYKFIDNSGYDWEVLPANSIAAQLYDAQVTADNKINVYHSASAPTVNGQGQTLSADDNGDIWIDSDDNNKSYRYTYNLGTSADWTNNPIDQLSGLGGNIFLPAYSTLISGVLPPVVIYNASIQYSVVKSLFSNGCYRIHTPSTEWILYFTNGSNPLTDHNLRISPNNKWLVSFYVNATFSSGTPQFKARLGGTDINGITQMYSSWSAYSPYSTSNTWQRISCVVDATNVPDMTHVMLNIAGTSNMNPVYIDGIMIEPLLGNNPEPSPFQDPNDSTVNALKQGTTIDSGGITLSSGGVIKSYLKDSFADNTAGIFLGWDTTEADYVLNIGDEFDFLKWDGANLDISGNITLGTNHSIKGGQTDYETGTGFFLGYSGADYKFSVGNSSKFLKWNGTNLEMSGSLTSSSMTTAATGQRVEINVGGTNEVRCYDVSNNLRGSLGVNNVGGDWAVLWLETPAGKTEMPLYALQNNTSSINGAITAANYANNFYGAGLLGIGAGSANSIGVSGYAYNGYALKAGVNVNTTNAHILFENSMTFAWNRNISHGALRKTDHGLQYDQVAPGVAPGYTRSRLVTPNYVLITEEQPAGTNAGYYGTAGTWTIRRINTLYSDGHQSFCAIAGGSYQFELQPGRYRIRARLPAAYCNSHKGLLYNSTYNFDVLHGSSERSTLSTGIYDYTHSEIVGEFEVANVSYHQLQHYVQSTWANNSQMGFPVNCGKKEIYTICEIWKVA